MKILFLTWKDIKHPYRWGAEKVMYNYMKWLVKRWHDVTWFSYSFPWCFENEIIDWIKIVRKFNLYSSYFLFPFFYKKYFKWKFDVIVDEAWWLPLLSPLYEKVTPIVFFAHHIWDKEWDYDYPWPLNKLLKKIYRQLFKFYRKNITITVSNSTKDELVDFFWFDKNKVNVLNNVCDLEKLDIINFEEKENSILFLGRLMPIKRVEHAIKAFAYFDSLCGWYTLNVMWNNQDKKYFTKLEQLVESLNIKDKVKFYWHVDEEEKSLFIQKNKIMLVPSFKEWFWIIVLEWNSNGLAVLWYNVPWLKDSIKDWENWFLIEDWNFEAMWERLYNILKDERNYIDLAKSSLEYVKWLNTWDDNVKEFESILNHML